MELYHFESLEKYPECFHAVTTKNESFPYQGSLALHTGEEQYSIIQNRNQIVSVLGVAKGYDFIVANQTHSDHIEVIIEDQSRGWENSDDAIADCDALITNQKGVILTIQTADCVPILLFDPQKEVIAAIHAGWKGTSQKIAYKTVQKMQEVFGCDPKDIIAAIAPSIGRCCYEVGQEVASHFFDYPRTFDQKGDKFMLDLPLANQIHLLNAGLVQENIHMSGICTACEVETFFSYRKEQGCSGRFMSMIGLKH